MTFIVLVSDGLVESGVLDGFRSNAEMHDGDDYTAELHLPIPGRASDLLQ